MGGAGTEGVCKLVIGPGKTIKERKRQTVEKICKYNNSSIAVEGRMKSICYMKRVVSVNLYDNTNE